MKFTVLAAFVVCGALSTACTVNTVTGTGGAGGTGSTTSSTKSATSSTSTKASTGTGTNTTTTGTGSASCTAPTSTADCASCPDKASCEGTSSTAGCCDTASPTGLQKFNDIIINDCLCGTGADCLSSCNGAGDICADPANNMPSQGCLACLNGLTATSACIGKFKTDCMADTNCTAYVGCLSACPTQ